MKQYADPEFWFHYRQLPEAVRLLADKNFELLKPNPWPVSLVHFDACVTTGVTQAARFLQRSVGAEPDGRIGPKTLEALRALLERETPLAVAERLVNRREPFYRRLAQVDPTQNRFLQGWLNRVEKLKTASGIA